MTRDPMLDCITRYSVRNDYLTSRAAVGDEPFKGSTDVVLFSDLPALLAATREDALEEAEKAVLDVMAWNGAQASFQGEALGAIAALRAREEKP